MKHLRFLLFVVLAGLVSWALGATHYPERFAGSDQQKLEKAFAACKDGDRVDLGSRFYTFGKPVIYGKGKPYNCIEVVGSGVWNQLTYTGVGSAFELWDIKGAKFSRVQIRRFGATSEGESNGFECRITGSSSWVIFEQCRAQGFTRGFYNNADPGKDGCHFLLTQCEAYECGVGFAWLGSNNLGPTFLDCAVSHSGVGWEMLGGSAFKMIGCGGSFTKVLYKIRGGFLGSIRESESEDCGLIYQIGGEGLDGYSQETTIRIEDIEHRNAGKLAEIGKAGTTFLSVDSLTGSNVVELTNKSGKQAFFYGSANLKTIKIEGDWKLGQAVGVEVGK